MFQKVSNFQLNSNSVEYWFKETGRAATLVKTWLWDCDKGHGENTYYVKINFARHQQKYPLTLF